MSSVELERACVEGVPCVMEVAAVGVPSPGGGPEQLVLFLVPRSGRENPDATKRQCQAAIRSRINPLFKVERVRPRTGIKPSGQRGGIVAHCLEQRAKGPTQLKTRLP